jgi:hypothetical protein
LSLGTFTALSACFIVVNVEYFSEKKYEELTELFNIYLSKNKIINLDNDSNTTLLSFYSNNSTSLQSLSFDKTAFSENLFKLQIPLLFWCLTNAIPVLLGSLLVTYLGILLLHYFYYR